MVDLSWVGPLVRHYATPTVGVTLILAGVFLRLLGKGVAFLVLCVGIVGTIYLVFKEIGTTNSTWLVPAVFLAGIAASVTLALALRALTAALGFGLFTVGWYLIYQAAPSFASWFPSLSSVTGVSTWMGSAILTTGAAALVAKRFGPTRRPAVTSAVRLASGIRGARR